VLSDGEMDVEQSRCRERPAGRDGWMHDPCRAGAKPSSRAAGGAGAAMSLRSRGRRLHVYRRGVIGGFLVGCCGVFFLIGISGLLVDPTNGGKWFGGALAAVSVAYIYILWRMCSVVLYSRGALVGTLLRPRWIEWDEIEAVALEDDHNLYGRAGHVPVIRLHAGRRVKLGAFFVPLGSRHDIAVAIIDSFASVRSSAGSEV
jgi:hypothetical protein